ncbi:hypothetical protein ACJX0J_016908 [Zea mays]
MSLIPLVTQVIKKLPLWFLGKDAGIDMYQADHGFAGHENGLIWIRGTILILTSWVTGVQNTTAPHQNEFHEDAPENHHVDFCIAVFQVYLYNMAERNFRIQNRIRILLAHYAWAVWWHAATYFLQESVG